MLRPGGRMMRSGVPTGLRADVSLAESHGAAHSGCSRGSRVRRRASRWLRPSGRICGPGAVRVRSRPQAASESWLPPSSLQDRALARVSAVTPASCRRPRGGVSRARLMPQVGEGLRARRLARADRPAPSHARVRARSLAGAWCRERGGEGHPRKSACSRSTRSHGERVRTRKIQRASVRLYATVRMRARRRGR